MARGEATFQANGQAWILRFSNNAICKAEEEFKQPFGEIVAGLGGSGFRFQTFRTLFRLGLSHHHMAATDELAGDLIDEIGMTEALRITVESIKAAMPAAKAAGAGEEPAAT